MNLMTFNDALGAATTPEAAFEALNQLVQDCVGAKLVTIMTLDMPNMLARRAYTNDPVSYPTSGTKPIETTDWFENVCGNGETFVANSLDDIAQVFPDYELIGSLGCGSVINLPILIAGRTVATMNILHEAGYYTKARADVVQYDLLLPATAAMLLYDRLKQQGTCPL
jgi:hypothetical protein